MIGVYALLFSNGDRYIGQSINISRRFSQHKYCLLNNKHSSSRVTTAYEEAGMPTLEVLCECKVEELDAKEEHFIRELDPCLNVVKYSTTSPKYYGDAIATSLLSNDEYLAIFKDLCDPSLSINDIAKKHGVHYSTVNNMARGCSLKKWFSNEFPEQYNEMLTLDRKRDVGIKLKEFPPIISPLGEVHTIKGTLAAFADKFGIHRSNLSAMINGRLKSVSGWRLQ